MTANDKSLASRASLSSTAEVTTEVQTRASETANDDFGSTHCRPTTHQQVVVPPAGAEATHPGRSPTHHRRAMLTRDERRK